METSQPPLSPVRHGSKGDRDGPTFGSIASRRRAALSLSDLRTPIVENILSMLPSGHDKALKYALYNVLALILTAVCFTTLWAAYCILEPFIVPLLWALLCGSVIHPFKDRLVTFTREWLGMVKASPTPLSLQLTFIPFRAIDSISDSVGTRVVTWWKYILTGCGGFFLTYLIYHNPPVTLGLVLYWIALFFLRSLIWFISWINGQFVLAVTAVYLGAIIHQVYGPRSPTRQPDTVTVPVPVAPHIKQEKSGEPAKVSDETDLGGGEGPPRCSNHPHTNPNPQDRLLMRALALLTWFLWFSFFCRLLPYPLLVLVFLSVFTGTVMYIRKRPIVPSFTTKYTALLSLFGANGGRLSTQSSRGVSRKGSIQQFSKSRRNTQLTGTPSPGGLQIMQLKESSSESLLGGSGEGPGEPSAGADVLGIKKLRPPMDLKFEQHNMASPYTSSGDIHAFSSDSLPLPSPINSAFGNGSEDEVDGALDSNKFLYGVLCACLIVQVWHRLWLVHLLPIPVVFFGVKRMCISFGMWDYVDKNFCRPFLEFYASPSGPSRDLFPYPVRVFFRIIYEADRKFISIFESYLDMVATIIILVAVMVFSVILLIFVATQFYAEGDHLVRVGANVINSTVSQYPEISQMLPEGWESLTGSLIGNAYHYGRDYIKTMIRDSVAERNPEKAEEMERQVIELWDRIYLSWNRTWGTLENTGATSSGSSVDSSDTKALEWDDIVKTGQNVTDWFDTSMLVNYVKSNYGQLRAVLESVYTVFVGNVSLAISAITSVLSVLFGGGTALLNLIISFIVFFTALFYLLSSSTSMYKPVELFNTWFPGDGKHSSNFVAAIEESVSGVFSATLKMSAFYGMWTWLTHTLFQVNIVFVPSFFAAIFAAVPLLMPYWAAFPAVLELWLIQGQWTKALIMLAAQMAPMSVVDAQIYSEIKGGGHPYLTALAVAGGMFYFGFQGAILGPVVLCVLFVAVKVSSSYMKEGTQMEFQ